MLRNLSLVAAIAATLAIPTAAWSGGKGGSSGDRHEDAHRNGAHFGGTPMSRAPMRNVGAVGNAGAVRSSGAVQGPNAPQNVVSPGASAGVGPRQAFYDRRRFRHHRGFFGTFFTGTEIGYSDDDRCWQWAEVPTPTGWARQQVWVCGDDYRDGDGYDQ